MTSHETGPAIAPAINRRFLLREWPYLALLALSLFGVAYTSLRISR